MGEYIERELLIHSVVVRKSQELIIGRRAEEEINGYNPTSYMVGFDSGMQTALDIISSQPSADVVDGKVLEQLKRERDTAVEQLQSYGVGPGEKEKLCKRETEKPLEELTDEEMRKDPRYLAPYKWCNNQPVPNIDEEHPCIIIRLKGTDYVSAGWLSKTNDQYYGDYMMLNPDCENPDENMKKTVCALTNMYIAIRDALTEGIKDESRRS